MACYIGHVLGLPFLSLRRSLLFLLSLSQGGVNGQKSLFPALSLEGVEAFFLGVSSPLSFAEIKRTSKSEGGGQTKGFCPLLDVFIPIIYRIFRATQNANRWRIINQVFAKSLPLDVRVKYLARWRFFT